ncbi:hypothetical protein CCYA_CCYA18G4479 [Cyanidiococcus yangmingshanensis]|nr:hypothetical protein CCYA_CCYA18G4479 [Cyanidiococcus yangmingshanensis]
MEKLGLQRRLQRSDEAARQRHRELQFLLWVGTLGHLTNGARRQSHSFITSGGRLQRPWHRYHAGHLKVRVPGTWRCCAAEDNQEPATQTSTSHLDDRDREPKATERDANDAARRELAEKRFSAVRDRVSALEHKLEHGEAMRRITLAEQLLQALDNPELASRLEALAPKSAPDQQRKSAAMNASTATTTERSTEPESGRSAAVIAAEERAIALARVVQQTQAVLETLCSWSSLPEPIPAKAKDLCKELEQRLQETKLSTWLSGNSGSSSTPAATETISPAARDFFNRAMRALRARNGGKAAVTDEELESVLSAAAQMRRTSALKAEMDRVLAAEAAVTAEAQRVREDQGIGASAPGPKSPRKITESSPLGLCREKGLEMRTWLKHFVTDTWQRLNGVPSPAQNAVDAAAAPTAVLPFRQRQALIFKHTVEDLKPLERKLQELSKEREMRLRREGPLGKLIHIRDLRALDDQVNALRRQISVRVLESEMERIYLYLDAELETSALFFLRGVNDEQEEMLLIAEYGLLARRLAEMQVLVDVGEAVLIEDDELADLASDIQFLKSRLGLGEDDAYMNLGSVVLDWSRIRQYLAEMSQKTKEGGEFYWRGVRLLGGDIMYTLRLIQRAAAGYTLTPREVRTIRRTGRDILTLVPFGILLALPLTPVGHVMVFSFIQRYFPSFFPSTFTDKRQELMKRYESLMRQISTLEKDSVAEDAEKASILARTVPEETHLASEDEDSDEGYGHSASGVMAGPPEVTLSDKRRSRETEPRSEQTHRQTSSGKTSPSSPSRDA